MLLECGGHGLDSWLKALDIAEGLNPKTVVVCRKDSKRVVGAFDLAPANGLECLRRHLVILPTNSGPASSRQGDRARS